MFKLNSISAWKIPVFMVAVLMAIPLFMVIISAVKVDGALWVKLWQNRLPRLFLNSVLLIITVTTGSLILGSLLSWLTERTDMPGRRWIKPLLTAPLIIPCYIIAICYTGFFGIHGLFEKLLTPMFGEVQIPNIYGFLGATCILIIGTYPYVYTILSAALRRLDPTLSETAKCLGASGPKRFFLVTLPLLAPAYLAGTTLVALYVLSDFGVVNLLRYNTFVNAIYEQMSGRYNFKVASALSLILVMLTIVFLIIQEWTAGRRRFFTSSPRIGTYSTFHLGSYRYPSMIFALFIVVLGLIIPIGILIYWFSQSFVSTGQAVLWKTPLGELIMSGINSISVSALAATIAVIIALPLAYWTVRKSESRLSVASSWMSQSGIALPGVLIALGLTLALNNVFPKLSFSVFAIISAFIIHFFAQGFQAIRSGFTQITVKIEESSRILGAKPFQTFWQVTRPLLKSSIWAGWILVFLSSMRELPASLLLRPAGFDTLTVKVWNAASEGFYEQAAEPALLLILLSLPLVLIVLYRQGNIYAHD